MKKIIATSTLALGLALAGAVPAMATGVPATKTLKWVLPDGGTKGNVTWPQPVFDAASVPCGTSVTVQVDTYFYDTPEHIALVDSFDDDGVLSSGEDNTGEATSIVQSYTFEDFTSPACEPEPTPTPTPEPTPPVTQTPPPAEHPTIHATPPAPAAPVAQVAQVPDANRGEVLASTGQREDTLRNIGLVGLALLVVSGVLFFIERKFKRA